MAEDSQGVLVDKARAVRKVIHSVERNLHKVLATCKKHTGLYSSSRYRNNATLILQVILQGHNSKIVYLKKIPQSISELVPPALVSFPGR
jgi:hypothetical protein